MWCHSSFWILPKLQLILDYDCMNAPTDKVEQGLYIYLAIKEWSTVLYINFIYFKSFKVWLSDSCNDD